MRNALFAALALISATSARGQNDPAVRPKQGEVSGVVTDGKSGEPVKKALVVLSPAAPPKSGSANIAFVQAKGIGVTTDALGQFSFQGVQPDTYIVSVEREGFVTARESQRQTVAVIADQPTADLNLKLLRTAAISGRVFDTEGDPVTGATIQLLPSRLQGNSRAAVGPLASTNDKGEYRLFHVAPGKYRLSATYAVPVNRSLQISVAGDSLAYPTQYYPGSSDLVRSNVITVEPGIELQGFDFHLKRANAVTVNGRLLSKTAEGSTILASLVTLAGVGQQFGPSHETQVNDPEGQFSLTDVLPGTYLLEGMSFLAPDGGAKQPKQLFGRRKLTVGNTDVSGILLTAGPQQKLSGHIILPEGRKLPLGFTVLLQSSEIDRAQEGSGSSLGPDMAFTIDEVSLGDFDVKLGFINGDSGGLYVSAIRLGDVDALAEGVSVTEAPLAPLEIILKANGGTLEASIKDEQGKGIFGATVLLVPDEPKRRQTALYGDCRTDTGGNCRITGITPGGYHVYPLPLEGTINRHDPDELKPLEKYGKAVKFGEGQKQTVELSRAPEEY